MSLDFGTPIFEVALGLSFVFFLFSLLISSVIEGIAALFQVREKNLATGVKRMLGDASLSDAVLAHPLVKADVTSEKRKPAYVSSRNFSLALTQILRKWGAQAAIPAGVDPGMAEVENGIEEQVEQLAAREQLQGLLEEASGQLADFRKAVEHWFDDGMDRVAGWYRSWSQILTCVLALAVAIGLNVDAIRIAERIGENTALKTAAVAGAEATVAEGEEAGGKGKEAGGGSEEAGGEGGATAEGAEADAKAAAAGAQSAISQIQELQLPILWSGANDNVTVNTLIGWTITFFALSLGAPFWFSALGKIAHLKTSGKEPAPAK